VVLGFSDPVTGVKNLDKTLPGVRQAAPVNVVVTEHQTQFRAGLARLLAAETRLKVVSGDANESGELEIQPLPDHVGSDTEPARVQILVFAADFGGATDGAPDENGGTHFGRNFTAEGIIARLLALYSSGTAVVTSSPPEVSKRELVVLAQVAAGLSNKQIGGLLGISQKTVRNHLSRIFSKLGAGNRTQAVMYAMRLGLLNI
jgi:DNA-binding NarL/FixJ family response regulator